jgi:hypothetical protein
VASPRVSVIDLASGRAVAALDGGVTAGALLHLP